MAKKGAPSATITSVSKDQLVPPEGGVTVRMYRTGHGDCFLLAFPREDGNKAKPVYVLIDCGYKPGSGAPEYINIKMADIAKNIRNATRGHIDLAIITHEHQDHVNGITKTNFKDITIDETWFAWTEDAQDGLANQLRVLFQDKLLGLLGAARRLATAGNSGLAQRIRALLAFELGGTDETFNDDNASRLLAAAGKDPANSSNKQSMKLFKDRARRGAQYLRPHEKILTLPGNKEFRIFVLGPPRNDDFDKTLGYLKDLDPQADEAFHARGIATASVGNYFAEAAKTNVTGTRKQQVERHGESPFAKRYALNQVDTFKGPAGKADKTNFKQHFRDHYGTARQGSPNRSGSGTGSGWGDTGSGSGSNVGYDVADNAEWSAEVPDNPTWRRIDNEWLYSAERLALDMNSYTNNTSLVLAIELGKGGKVLLFAGDAQRGNWHSWTQQAWLDEDKKVTVRELLARTVLYKVGHHGSHNATLNGRTDSEYANLAWMAHGEYRREFTAMITAVRAWATTKEGWDHPLPAIKNAILQKTSGRLFQTDTTLDQMSMPSGTSTADWEQFLSRTDGTNSLYFDYNIMK